MDVTPKYSFVPLEQMRVLNDKSSENLLEKWGINLQIQHFLFNEPFYQYHKYDLVEAFFKDQIVARNLKIWTKNSFKAMGLMASEIEMKQIPCSVMSMSFFDKLKDPKKNIVNDSGGLNQRLNSEISGILVADNLRGMLLDEDCDEFNLYTKDERNEFIFRILQLLVLGGEYCQYEDDLNPYLEVTKALYKNCVRIGKYKDNNTFISTIVLEVIAKIDTPYFPKDPEHKQNIGFVLVDGINRKITTILHQFKGCYSE